MSDASGKTVWTVMKTVPKTVKFVIKNKKESWMSDEENKPIRTKLY